MTRKKVKLVWIANDSARKASFKKRKQGLLKKVKELTTLCDVSALVIIYGPNDNEAAIWPSHPIVEELLARFESIPEIERCKKMMNQETYLKERGLKMHEQLRKHHKKNGEKEMGYMMHQISQGKQFIEFQTSELTNFFWMIDDRMKEIRRRAEYIQHVPLPPVGLPPPPFQGAAPTGGNMIMGETWWDNIYADIIKNKGSSTARATSSVRSETGFPYGSTANELGLQFGSFPYRGFNETGRTGPGMENFGGTNRESSEMSLALGLPHNNYNSYNSSNAMDFHEYMGRNITRLNQNDNLQGVQKGGNSTIGSDLGFPSNLFTGSSTAGSDAGLPYDVTKAWLTPPSP